MGIINVQGIGPVQIEGDKPTEQEQQTIMKASVSKVKDDAPSITEYLKSPEFARMALETAGGMLGAAAIAPLTGGLSLPVALARGGMLARPFLTALLRSSVGSAVGSAGGAVVAHPIDPKDPLVKDITNGAISGFLQEAIGAPAGIKAGEALSKVFNPKIKMLEGVQDAENILKSQSQKIIDNPSNYTAAQVEAAKNNFLTPALKTDNRIIDTLQNMTESSYLGAGEIIAKKEGAKTVAETALNDFINPMLNNDPAAVGQVFKSAITDSEDLWKASMNARYSAIDKQLAQYSQKLSKPIVDPVTGVATIDPNATKIVDMTGFKNALLKYKEEAPFTGQSRQKLINFIDDYTKGVPDQAGFKEANEFRSDILRAYRDFEGKDVGLIKSAGADAANEITQAIQNAAKRPDFPEGLKELYNTTNEAYRLGKTDFNSDIIEKLMNKPTSTDLYNAIIRNDKGETLKNTLSILDRRAKEVGNTGVVQDVKDSIKGTFLQNGLSKATIDSAQYGNAIDANAFRKYLDKYPEVQKQLLSSGDIEQLNKLTKALGITQGNLSKAGKLGGGLFMQFKQAGALVQLGGAVGGGYAGSPETAVAFLAGPKVLSKMLLNPGINKYLFEGLTAQTYPKASFALSRLLGRLTSEGLMSTEENNSLQQKINQGPTMRQPIQSGQPQSALPISKPTQMASTIPASPTNPGNIFAAGVPAASGGSMAGGMGGTGSSINPSEAAEASALFGRA